MSNRTYLYERFPRWRRVEHLVMLLTFTTLAATGLPQKFPESTLSINFVSALGGIENLRTIHHTAAIVMMLGTVWHLLVFGYLSYVRRVRLSMLPSLQDLKDGWQALLYNVGLAKSFPQMGRYTFEEKMEYWAFVWGTLIMVITGFIMWNPISTARFFPGQVIPAAKAAHGGEAVLAVLAIIVWHMYGVHIKRFNKSMFTGKISEAEMLHEHPLELADIKAGIAERPVDSATVRQRQRTYLPVAGVIAVLLLGGIYGFVNAEQTALTTIQRQAPTLQVFVPQTATPAPTQTQTLEPTLTATPVPPTDTPLPSPTSEQPSTDSTPTASAATSNLTWANDISPILQAKCAVCHGANASGGLNLSTYADALKGGNTGPAIIPGDSDNSVLVIKQLPGDHFGQLTADELALVIEWIKAGAPEK